jgi:hypothetical protein
MIFLDRLRRMIGGEARPVDLWLTAMEILVLLLIALEFGWSMKDRLVKWQGCRKHKSEINSCLRATRNVVQEATFASADNWALT